jgi:class 3 adenylate cyclase
VQSATKSAAIIKSLFPKGIRNKLLDDGQAMRKQRFEKMLPQDYAMAMTNKMRLANYLMPINTQGRSNQTGGVLGGDPIAEFFPSVSVMYADLSGFTAWSSSREPAQVFTLLETLYGAMDKTAKKMGVFKVETIGDCYVAATGMPDPRPDHAVLMAKFANVCLSHIKELTSTLESQLGPGTGDLAFRVGIHSGPVTAGVLRGEKSRFQLFGDTMTTCAKIESAGEPGRIHTSKITADMLIAHGKGNWLEETGEAVVATGRGGLVTYWLNVDEKPRKSKQGPRTGSVRNLGPLISDAESHDGGPVKTGAVTVSSAKVGGTIHRSSVSTEFITGKNDRLVSYNVEVMLSLLKKIVARRSVVDSPNKMLENTSRNGSIALDEVRELIAIPEYNEEAAIKLASDYKVEIPDDVRRELRDYIFRLAAMYPPNPFHK